MSTKSPGILEDTQNITHRISRHICGERDGHKERFTTACMFPWSDNSIETIWDGRLLLDGQRENWQSMIRIWGDVVILGGLGGITLVSTGKKNVEVITSYKHENMKNEPVSTATWAFRRTAPFTPLIAFACSALLYIFDTETACVIGILRGHGGPIKTLKVHPNIPHLLCTTSRDFSVRIYDLHLDPSTDAQRNIPWSPAEKSNKRAGAPHGLHASENEGHKLPADHGPIGRCVAILAGSRSGGHQAAVIDADFHPKIPVIATCGLDRAVKIWRLSVPTDGSLYREDKPLFSCTTLHPAGVLSISWVGDETLISHCMEAFLTSDLTKARSSSIILWKWLSMQRFFPTGQVWDQRELRGIATDYLESASFEILASFNLPAGRPTPRLCVYNFSSLRPTILLPQRHNVRVIPVTNLQPFDKEAAVPDLNEGA